MNKMEHRDLVTISVFDAGSNDVTDLELSIKKAWKGQQGLYNAIKDLGLDVHTIVQSWPISKYGTKCEFPFSDLEASMNVK